MQTIREGGEGSGTLSGTSSLDASPMHADRNRATLLMEPMRSEGSLVLPAPMARVRGGWLGATGSLASLRLRGGVAGRPPTRVQGR